MVLVYIGVMSIIVMWSVVSIFVVRNLLKQVETYEELKNKYDSYYGDLLVKIKAVLSNVRAVDIRGSFESDDEVGSTFKIIKSIILELEEFLGEETSG